MTQLIVASPVNSLLTFEHTVIISSENLFHVFRYRQQEKIIQRCDSYNCCDWSTLPRNICMAFLEIQKKNAR